MIFHVTKLHLFRRFYYNNPEYDYNDDGEGEIQAPFISVINDSCLTWNDSEFSFSYQKIL